MWHDYYLKKKKEKKNETEGIEMFSQESIRGLEKFKITII